MIRKISFFIFYFAMCSYGMKTARRSLSNADRDTQRSKAGAKSNNQFDDPDLHTNVSGLIKNKGYPVEEHIVQTEDGYLLSVQRIPHGRSSNTEGKDKDVVLLIHGVLGDATNWVLNFPNQSLGFILPDEGYDTWLLNVRGCTYSRNHVTYTTNQYRFWNFSFDQVAQYDVPATIDYILDVTGKKDLYVVAHSQGTTAVFAMLSEMPDYNDKVKLFIALAPVVFLGHFTSAARVLVPFAYPIAAVVNGITSGEFLPNNRTSRIIREKLCGVLPELCESVLFAIGGSDRLQLNETRLPVYFAHFPSGTSVKSLLHYAQLVKSKKFRKFDYRRRNMNHYHQAVPPDYDLSLITTPTAFFWSTNDKFTNPKDVDILRGKLKSTVFENLVPYPYDHFDFVIALNAAKLIYKPVLQLLAQY